MPSPIDNPLLEAALENAEVAADLLTSNEVLREIPVVGTALNIIRGVRDVRERIFAHKPERFVAGLEVSDCGVTCAGSCARHSLESAWPWCR